MKRCLVVFAKEPGKSRVKTRLSKQLSKTQRVELYKAFLKDTVDLAESVRCEKKILAYDSGSGSPAYLKRIARPFKFYKQRGRDLGERMDNAFKYTSENKVDRTVIIGSDSPNLPVRQIEEAFRRLYRNDVVVGPSFDGGYYLIGMKEPCPGLFKGIKWGSDRVLKDTLKKSRRLGRKACVLKKWYDIDRPEDISKLKYDMKRTKNNNCMYTRNYIYKYLNNREEIG
ncbi:MAG: TIGR04282 family arsenosugar biosynthesis glycosyltransferase [Candidatus Omnitrophota bacterium]